MDREAEIFQPRGTQNNFLYQGSHINWIVAYLFSLIGK